MKNKISYKDLNLPEDDCDNDYDPIEDMRESELDYLEDNPQDYSERN